MQRIRHLIRKEFLELRQDPRLFGIVIMAPLLQLTLLGVIIAVVLSLVFGILDRLNLAHPAVFAVSGPRAAPPALESNQNAVRSGAMSVR